jgi:2-polyprenyl-3-methyl-5-hydroxy-6-metoxy-1,4-benzoquinol methylase
MMMQMRESRFKKLFDTTAIKYEEDHKISQWSEHVLRSQISTFYRYFREFIKTYTTNIILLDVGCGPGTYARQLATEGFRVIGIDYSKPMIMKAREKSAVASTATGNKIDYIIGDAYHLPIKAKSVGIVLCLGLLQHISDEKRILAELNEVLSDTSSLFLMTLNAHSIYNIYLRVYHRLKLLAQGKVSECFSKRFSYNSTTLLRRYDPFLIKNYLGRLGFKKIMLCGVYIFPEKLRVLESLFENRGWFKILDKLPISIFFAHSFLIIGLKSLKSPE